MRALIITGLIFVAIGALIILIASLSVTGDEITVHQPPPSVRQV